MKFFALALLVLNAALWYAASKSPESQLSNNVVTGTLPRVGSLKFSDLRDVSSVEPAGSANVIGSGEPLAQSCVTVGWFDTRAAAETLADEVIAIRSQGYRVQQREREFPPLHWVIIPPQPEQVALEQLRNLRKQGVDSYLVTQGENRNAISLGLFESLEAAISVLEEKKHQNLNAVLVNFPRNQLSYALSFEARPELVEKRVRAAEADYGNNFDFIEINACEGVATPAKTP
ncbi:hypothetical protein SAMN05216369_3548 [Marinobacter antarcticus]|uniref:Sporulation related domain-containing protein n=1 Tax=Marinobacter antarcticus TaxID=564117 RepID=A0A1M6W9V4_9GAMM|nr:hypothetical protein [Marinobacter antarcticus]SHK90511.1 hypothetical protein SAMN05216369_3548 [Marinobacter antarcticus]